MSFRSSSALLFAGLALVTAKAARGDEVSAYAQIKPSLALVAAGTGPRLGFGTAFCIESQGGYGFLLTNKHVVGNDPHPRILLMSDPHPRYAAIVRLAEIDAVVLAIHTSCTPVTIEASPPPVGTRIAIAGFPAFQISIFAQGLGLTPSFHEGAISSVIAGGAYLEYDAQTDHGNSGSPLFDAQTGEVYGLVTGVNTGTTGALQNNIAIGARAFEAFIQNSHHDIEVGLQSLPATSTKGSQPQVKPSKHTAPTSADLSSSNFVGPSHVSTDEEQRCVIAFRNEDSGTVMDACYQAQAKWEKQREAADANSPHYYDATLTMGYYVCYTADAFLAFQDARASSFSNECESLLKEVIEGSDDSAQADRAGDALDFFSALFALEKQEHSPDSQPRHRAQASRL
jgi:hypothetical protein